MAKPTQPIQLTQIKKLNTFESNPNLAIFDELQEANAALKIIAEKEIPEMPKMPEIDFTKTNELLERLIEKTEKNNEPVDIKVRLNLI